MYILVRFQGIPFCGIDEENLFNSQDLYLLIFFFFQLLCLIDQYCCKEKFNFGHSELLVKGFDTNYCKSTS